MVWQDEKSRWQRILEMKDEKSLWHAINWKGEFLPLQTHDDRPSDESFKKHLEQLLNPVEAETLLNGEIVSQVDVPLLDQRISPMEIDSVIKMQLKPDKGCGPDGIPPVTFKLLPVQWILCVATLCTTVFYNHYPQCWNLAKLQMLFKKGLKNDCNNSRGISIIKSISKLYDYVLCNRLTQWFKPAREQAGAQAKRGCIEHIVALRLLMDMCVRKRLPLFIIFVYFSKAYDRVPRRSLMEILRDLGCGKVMLAALVSMYIVQSLQEHPWPGSSNCSHWRMSGFPNILLFIHCLRQPIGPHDKAEVWDRRISWLVAYLAPYGRYCYFGHKPRHLPTESNSPSRFLSAVWNETEWSQNQIYGSKRQCW
jgi:hypothetical protein